MAHAGRSWLSQGLEVLIDRFNTGGRDADADFDVLVVGSGYGGAVAASRLAWTETARDKPTRVCILERGKEYLPGMFPGGLSDLPGHVRLTTPPSWGIEAARESGDRASVKGLRDGLFDIRIDDDVNVLVASGLGGGSLINAGVMEEPTPETFAKGWPSALRKPGELSPFYRELKKELGATVDGHNNTVSRHEKVRQRPLAKHEALRKLANGDRHGRFREAAITVAMTDGPNDAGVELRRCKLCGDCATGCNFGAKDSLDVNLLARARRREAVSIFTGATVLYLQREGESGPWQVHVTHTLPALAKKAGENLVIRAHKVILAAGALGSTEILMRSSRKRHITTSCMLGSRFSGNGDMIAVGYGMAAPVNGVADEASPPDERHIGPTITGVIDRRHPGNGHPVVIEEMAVPGAMRRVFEEIYTTASSLRQLATTDWRPHGPGHPQPDPLSVDSELIAHSQIYAVIGPETTAGRLLFRDDFADNSDAAVTIHWPRLRGDPLFPDQIDQLETLTRLSGSGGSVIPNPLWRALPESVGALLKGENGPLMSVHPLGGCPMGDSAETGVVDHMGRVFTGEDNAVYPDLAVLDGSIVPGPVGTNPALTIAAVSARAVTKLIESWNWNPLPDDRPRTPETRPDFATPRAPRPIAPTVMQFAERLSGEVELDLGAGSARYHAELTLYFEDKPLAELTAPRDDDEGSRHRLLVSPRSQASEKPSQLRLHTAETWEQIDRERLSGQALEDRKEQLALLTAPLSGDLTILAREPSCWGTRTWRACSAFWRNRGFRDAWQALRPLAHEKDPGQPELTGWRRVLRVIPWFVGLMRHLSRAGEVRLFEYRLALESADGEAAVLPAFENGRIEGRKRIGYMRRGNPLRQLMEVSLQAFPGLVPGTAPVLKLRPEFLARKGQPLFRISSQHDLPQAMADVLSLATYFVRLIASTHLLSLRAPDKPAPRTPNRLPGDFDGAPEPVQYRQSVDRVPADVPASHRGDFLLTRYCRGNSAHPPVLLIHGYSASGTTFAHHSIKPNLAGYLLDAGRDVWVLDMRSSCGMPSCRRNYRFEELAFADIPLAVERVCAETGAAAIDVVAHCMGSAMLSMGLLSADAPPADAPYPEALRALPGRIHKLVMSQVGPLVCMAPDNIFRAYAFSFLKHFLPLDQYQFQPGDAPFEQALDQILALMPYEDDEYDLENPRDFRRRTPFTRTRRRMDLLYGRTFSLKNLSPETLEHIDDLFGPLSVDTATQVVHFARYQTVTDHSGNNRFVSREKLCNNWGFPTLSLHGRENGLAWRATVGRQRRILKDDAGRAWDGEVLDGLGHQDSLIGTGAEQVFSRIVDFLDAPVESPVSPSDSLCIQTPWSGPVMEPLLAEGGRRQLPLSFGINPALSRPALLLAVPLREEAWGFGLIVDGNGAPSIIAHSLADARIEMNWCRITLDLPVDTDAGRLLLLLVYRESPRLDNAVFGEQPAGVERFSNTERLSAQGDWLDPAVLAESGLTDSADVIQSALHDYLTGNALRLRDGLLRLPRDEAGDRLTLAVGSCQFPPGMLDQWPGFNSYFRLAAGCYSGAFPLPDLLLLCGDQIYVDSTAGMFDPAAKDERYLHPYQRWYRSSAVRAAFREIPARMMLDDHEIVDNWEPVADDDRPTAQLSEALAYFRLFQRGPTLADREVLWNETRRNGFDIFMLDTRTERSPRNVSTLETADLLFDPARSDPQRDQRAELDAWLARAADEDPWRPRFIVAPAMPFPRERRAVAHPASAIFSDSWAGYPASLEWLVDRIAHHRVHNLVLLNGDAHLSCIAEVELPEEELCFWSVHCSGLYSPLPFANARPEDFEADGLKAIDGRKVALTTTFAPPGDGFCILETRREADGWSLWVSFDREGSDPAWRRQIPLRSGCAHPAP